MDVCLLLDGETLPRWSADALTHLLDTAEVDITTVVSNERDHHRTVLETIRRGVELREWAIVGTLYELLSEPIPELERVPVDSIVDRDGVVEYTVEPTIVDGWKQEIPADVASAVADQADLAIRFGFGFLVGPMLSAPEYGVLSFHHGDIREYRGQPAGFWEFVNGESSAGITVQQLSETLDAGSIAALRSVDISDLHTWRGIRRRLFEASEPMLAMAVRTLRNGEVREPEQLGDLYTLPRGKAVATFAMLETMGRLRGTIY